jgi:hypothetical protein
MFRIYIGLVMLVFISGCVREDRINSAVKSEISKEGKSPVLDKFKEPLKKPTTYEKPYNEYLEKTQAERREKSLGDAIMKRKP